MGACIVVRRRLRRKRGRESLWPICLRTRRRPRDCSCRRESGNVRLHVVIAVVATDGPPFLKTRQQSQRLCATHSWALTHWDLWLWVGKAALAANPFCVIRQTRLLVHHRADAPWTARVRTAQRVTLLQHAQH